MSIPQRENLDPEEIQDLIIDATENRIKRQKKNQKNIILRTKHLFLKTEIQVTKKGKIAYALETVLREIHDFTLLKNG